VVVAAHDAVYRLEAYYVVEHDEHSLKEEGQFLTYIRYVIKRK
jgi:hypothetical protein